MTVRAWAVGVMMACAVSAPGVARGQASERLSDKDVKALIEGVSEARDNFVDHLDGKVKDSIIRGPRGEVKVSVMLDDLKDNVAKLKERFTTNYSASAEVSTLLTQASTVHKHLNLQAKEIKGRSEWDRFSLDLTRLAEAYDTTFPLPPDGPVRRINDGETAKAMDAIVKQADLVKKAFDKDTALPVADRNAAKAALDELEKTAKVARERVEESKPSSSEARQLFSAIARFDEAIKGRKLAPATLTEWGMTRAPLETLAQAYRIRRPS